MEFLALHRLPQKLSQAVNAALFTDSPESVIASHMSQLAADKEDSSVMRIQALIRGLSARRRFRQLMTSSVTNVLMLMDPGQDLDDEMTLVLLRALVERELVRVLGVVTTLEPATMRAQLAHGTLCKLGLPLVPVAAGSDGGSSGDTHGLKNVDYVDYVRREYVSTDASEMMTNIMNGARDLSITFVVVASLRDVANQLKHDHALFKRKVKEVVIMGGVLPCEPGELLQPDTAHNNQFDRESAEFLYTQCQVLGIPLLVVSRFAAYSCQLPRSIYDDMAATGSIVGEHLKNMQAQSIERLWRRSNEPEGSALRAGLPMRCDKNWFCDTFCSGRGRDRDGTQAIWDLIQGFNMYDPISLVAAVPQLKQFFEFEPHVIDGVTHRIIGKSKEQTGIREPEKLRDFLYKGFMDGIQGEIVKEHQRRELLERQRRQLQTCVRAIAALKRSNHILLSELESMHSIAQELTKENPEEYHRIVEAASARARNSSVSVEASRIDAAAVVDLTDVPTGVPGVLTGVSSAPAVAGVVPVQQVKSGSKGSTRRL